MNATADATAPPRRAFRADIQGLRAVAVALVLLDHARVPFVAGGFVGVDVFFVISGFLISVHLLDGLRRTGRIDFTHFYQARARRILPAALVTIAATALASFVLLPPLRVGEALRDGIAAALYLPNVLFAVEGTDYLAGTEPSPFQHFWSLGVEEQFYLLWPVLLLVLFAVTRRHPRRLVVGIALVAAASLACSVLLTPTSPSVAFFSPHTRAWEFAVGALLAAGAPLLSRVPAALGRVLGWGGLALVLAAATQFSSSTDYPGTAALVPVLGAALLIGFGDRGGWGAGALLGLRPVQFVGAISYSLYLVHWPILVFARERLGLAQPMPVALAVLLVLAAVPVAWLLYRYVETPFRRGRTPHRRAAVRSLAASSIVSLALVATLVAGGAAAAQLPLTTGRAADSGPVARYPLGTRFVPSNLTPALADATTDTGTIYSNGCQQNLVGAAVLSCAFGDIDSSSTMALFGDSHAGRWFPAVEQAADALGYRLETFTKSGCRAEETDAAWSSSANPSCSSWRAGVLAALAQRPPDVIVIADHLGPRPGKNPDIQRSDWTDGISDLLERLPEPSRVVLLADSPEFASSPPVCLSAHLRDADRCSVARADALNPSIAAAQRDAAATHGVSVIDLSDYFCNATECPAVIGARLAYSDEHHVTATYSAALGPVLLARLRAVVPPG